MPNEITFQEAVELYRAVYHRFERIEGHPWGAEAITIELVKQVGELAKCVMGMEHYYFPGRGALTGYEANQAKLGDELADILAQVIRLADHYQLDLAGAFVQARQAETESLGRLERQA